MPLSLWRSSVTLRRRIILVIAVTWLAAVAVCSIYMYNLLNKLAITEWQSAREREIATLAKNLNDRLDELVSDIALIANLPYFDTLPDVEKIEENLNGLPLGINQEARRILDDLAAKDRFSVMFILLPDGRHYISNPFSTQIRLKKFNLADRPYFIESKRTLRPTISDAFVGADSVPAIVLNVPRLDADGQIIFHMGAVVHLDDFSKWLATANIAGHDITLLIDRQGEAIALSDAARQGRSQADQRQLAALLAEFLQGEESRKRLEFKADHSGETVFSSFTRLENGWGLAMARDLSSFIAQSRRQHLIASLVIASVLLSLSAVCLLVATRIAKRWEQVQEEAEIAYGLMDHIINKRDEELEEVRAQEAQKSAALATIMDNISQGITLVDEHLLLITSNKRARDLLDLPEALFTPGMSLEEVFRYNAERGEYGPGDPEAQVVERVEKARRFAPHRFERERPDGSVLEIVGRPVPGGGFVTSFTDVTERRKTDEQLRTLSRAIEQSPVSVMITDPGGHIEYVNPRFVQVSGYSVEEAIRAKPSILKSGETPPHVYAELWQTIKSGGDWRGELRNRRKDGVLFWEMVHISPLRETDGLISHFIAVKEDITEKKQAEAALQRSQKMDAIGQLSGGIAHDFNNIIGIISGNLEMAKLLIKDRKKAEDRLDNALKATRRASALTRKLLNFSRRQTQEASRVDVNHVIRDMQELLGRSITSQIELKVSLADDLWEVESDPGDLGDTLVNLVNNARDAMPNGGELSIETANIQLLAQSAASESEIPPGEYVLLTVADNGQGMSQETRERAFEPFFSTKPMDQGTGLGLSMVYGFVRRSKGGIRIYSEENRGTAIHIYLPRAKDESGASRQSDVAMIDEADLRGAETILICDDESELAALVGGYLEGLGYRVILSRNAKEALALLDQGAAVDLLLTDVIMPGGMNGFELVEAAKLKDENLRFLAASGFARNMESMSQHNRHAVPFLAKPYKLEELACFVRKILDEKGSPP
jgi:PAS domain S-box-containing protein